MTYSSYRQRADSYALWWRRVLVRLRYVIYKAIGDFSDLMAKAAAAKAAMEDLKKTADAETASELAGVQKATQARQADTDAINKEATSLNTLAAAAKNANVQTVYGGRSSMEQHLSDLQQMLNYETLLNRQKWMGFSSAQQAYSFQQQLYQQKLLQNRADFAGYQTADQYLSYLQKEITSYSAMAAAIKTRAAAIQQETSSMVSYQNAVQGTHQSMGQLGESGSTAVSNAQQYQAALAGVPDTVTTKLSLDDSEAMTALAAYRAELASIPKTETTRLTTDQSRGAEVLHPAVQSITENVTANVEAAQAALASIPSEVHTLVSVDIGQAMVRLSELRAEIAKIPRVVQVETVVANVGGGSGGDLGSSLGNLSETITPTIDPQAFDKEFHQLAEDMSSLRMDAQDHPITPTVDIGPAEKQLADLSKTEHITVDETITPVAQGGAAGSGAPPPVPPVAKGGAAPDPNDKSAWDALTKSIQSAEFAEATAAAQAKREAEDFAPNPNDDAAWEKLTEDLDNLGQSLNETDKYAADFSQAMDEVDAHVASLNWTPAEQGAARFVASLKEIRDQAVSTELAIRDLGTVQPLAAAGSGGSGKKPPTPPPTASGGEAPNPNDKNAWDALTSSINQDTKAFDELRAAVLGTDSATTDAIAKLRSLAASADNSRDAANYASAADNLQAAAQKAVGDEAQSTVARLAQLAANSNDSGKAALAASAAQRLAAAAMADTATSADKASTGMKDAGGSVAAAIPSLVASTGGWFLLNSQLNLFGGLMPGVLGHIALWHIALDVIIESLAILIPAMVTMAAGLGAFGLAATLSADTLGRIRDRLVAVNAASTATGQAIPPMTDAFNKLQGVIRPQTWQLYGDALNLAGSKMGVFGQLAEKTGAVLDSMAGRFVAWADSASKGINSFLAVGGHDLAGLGQVLTNIGNAFMNLIRVTQDTHIDQFFLQFLIIVSQFLDVLTKVPAPVLAAGFALHALWMWGGLASQIVLQLINPLRSLAVAAGGLAATDTALGKLGEDATPVQKLGAALQDVIGGFAAIPSRIAGTTSAVDKVGAALGMSAAQVQTFQAGLSKLGASAEAAVPETMAVKVETLGKGLDQAGQDALNLGAAMGASEPQLAKLAQSLSSDANEGSLFGGIASKLTAIPLGGWAVAAVAAIAVLSVVIAKANDATQLWIKSMDSTLTSQSAFTVVGKTVADLAAVTQQLANAQHGGAGNAAELAAAQNDLSGKLQTELVHVGDVSKAYGTNMVGALALLNTAGVKTSDIFSNQAKVWAGAMQQVAGLVEGYKMMGQGLTQLQGDVSVQLVMNADQLAQMQKLNTAWDSWLKLVTGGQSAFVTFQQNLATTATNAAAAGASMGGLNANSLTLRGSWQTLVTQGGSVLDAIRSQSAVLQNGAKGTAILTQSTKDLAAEMIPLAGNNKAAQASLLALVQEADPSINTWQKLTKWVGNEGAAQAAQDLNKQMTDLEMPVSQLAQDAAKLTTALQSDLNPAMAAATFNAMGGQKAFNTFSTDLLKFGPNAQPTITAGKQVAQELLSIDKNSTTAKNQFVAWAESMGLGAGAANKLWTEVSKGETPLTSMRQGLAQSATQADNLAKSGLWAQMRDLTTSGFGQMGTFFSKTLPNAFITAGHAIETAWNGTVKWFQGTGKTFESAWTTTTRNISSIWDRAWSGVARPVTQAFDAVEHFVSSSFDTWWKSHGSEMEQVWKLVWGNITMVATGVWKGIEDAAKFAWNVITGQFVKGGSSLFAPIEGAAKLAWNQVAAGARTAWSVIAAVFGPPAKALWSTILVAAKDTWSLITAAAKVAWDTIAAGGKLMWALVVAAAKIAWDTVVALFSVALDLITGHWSKAWADMKAYATQVWNALVQLGKSVFDTLENYAKQVWNAIWKFFDSSIVQPMGNFFTKTVPGWYNQISQWWSSTWNSNMKSFQNEIINPFLNFFTKTIPGWYSNISTWWSNTWNANMKAFQNEIINPFLNFFTKTIPGWYNNISTWWSNTWNANMKAFQNEIINPFSSFFTKTIPSWWNTLSTDWSHFWSTAWTDFVNHILNPMENWFSKTLPNAIQTGIRDGINWVISNVINKVINFINNDILAHLPGSLKIQTVQTVATGGEIGYAGGSGVRPIRMQAGSVPGTGDEDGTHIIAMGGEYMLRKPARMALERAYGSNFMNTLNQADQWLGAGSRGNSASQKRPPGYADGGFIAPEPYQRRRDYELPRSLPFPSLQTGPAPSRKYATGGQIVSEAEKFIGAPYVWGGTSPSGWDCSGFVQYVLDQLGWHNVPRTSEQQWPWTSHTSSPSVGGLVFANFPGEVSPGHVGFYVGNGQVLSARDPATGTGIDALSSWRGYIVGYGNEPNATGLFGQVVGGLGNLIAEAWQGVEGLTNAAGNALGSLVAPLAGDVTGGASELLKLAQQGATAIFNGVWDHSVKPMVGVVPGDTIPGAILQGTAANIKTGIDNFMTGQDNTAKSSAAAAASAGSAGGISSSGVSNSSAMAALQSAAAKMGWTGAQWTALYDVEMREAGFSLTAKNPSSGAYGMAQFINGPSEYAQYGGNSTTAAGQATAMVNYIKQRYGTPAAAWAHEQSAGWYAGGGPVGYYANGNEVVNAIESATGSTDIREAMSLGSWLESRWDPDAVGDEGTSFGPFQIHLPAHPGVTKAQAENPSWAAKYMLPSYSQAVNTVGSTAFSSNAMNSSEKAAYLAERPAVDYFKSAGTGTVSTGWKSVLQALGQTPKVTAVPGKSGSAGGGAGAVNAQPLTTTPTGPQSSEQTIAAQQAAFTDALVALTTAETNESNAFWTMNVSPLPSGTTTQQWEEDYAWLNILKGQQGRLTNTFNTITQANDPTSLTTADWTSYLSNIQTMKSWEYGNAIPKANWGDENIGAWPAGYPVGSITPSGWATWKYQNGAWATANKAAAALNTSASSAYDDWKTAYTVGSTGKPPTSATPGVVITPSSISGPTSINLDSLIIGGPAHPVLMENVPSMSGTGSGFAITPAPVAFAAGGDGASLSDVAGMFAMGGTITPALARASLQQNLLNRLSTSGEKPRTLSDAAASSRVGVQVQGDVNISNPRPEKPSESIARASNRLAFMAGRGAY